MMIENSKKLKKMQNLATIVESEISNQNERINNIIFNLLSKFDVYKN